MKSHRILIALSVLVLTIFSVGAVSEIWYRLHTLYPTPETESAFLKNYAPHGVPERFECRLPSSSMHESGSVAGRKFITHEAGFKWLFAMRSEKWMPLMNALSDDVSAQLLQNGAQILGTSGDPRSGFHFDYKLGKSVGTVRILPLAITPPSRIQRGAPLTRGRRRNDR